LSGKVRKEISEGLNCQKGDGGQILKGEGSPELGGGERWRKGGILDEVQRGKGGISRRKTADWASIEQM